MKSTLQHGSGFGRGTQSIRSGFTSVALLALLTIAFLGPGPLSADTVFLRNGKVLYGQIVSQNRTMVIFRSNGKVQRIQKAQIRRMQYGDLPEKKQPPVVKKPIVQPPADPPRLPPQPKEPAKQPEPDPTTKPPGKGSAALPAGSQSDYFLDLRFGLLSGRHDSDFEERSRYSDGLLTTISGGGTSVAVAPAWANNHTEGAELGAEFFYRGLWADLEILTGTQETVMGNANFRSTNSVGAIGGATIERNTRTLSAGYGRDVGLGLRVGALIGQRELLLEETVGRVFLLTPGATQAVGVNGLGGRGLINGPVYSLRLTWESGGDWMAGLVYQRYGLSGGRTLNSASVTAIDSSGVFSGSIELSPGSSQYRHSGSRVQARVGYHVGSDWWVFVSHLQEAGRVRLSQVLQPSFSIDSSGNSGGNLPVVLFPGSQHKERFKVTLLGAQKRLNFTSN